MIRVCLLLLLICSLLVGAEPDPEPVDVHIDGPVLGLLERIARLNQLDLLVLGEAEHRLEQKVVLHAESVSWDDLLALLGEQYRIALRIEDGTLLVRDAERLAAERTELRWYDLRALTRGVTTYAAPSLIPSDFVHTMTMGAELPDPAPPSADGYLDLVTSLVAPRSWYREGTSIDIKRGRLAVVAEPQVHGDIAELLRDMERAESRMAVVRVWHLPDQAVSRRAVLPAEDWARRRAELAAPAMAFLCRDGQRNHQTSLRWRSVVDGAEVEGNSINPWVSMHAAGMSVECRVDVLDDDVLLTTWIQEATAGEAPESSVADADGTTVVELAMQRSRIRQSGDERLLTSGAAALYPARNGGAWVIEVEALRQDDERR